MTEERRIAFDEKYAKCPFFQKSMKRAVTCEGLVNKTTMTVAFEHIETKRLFFRETCCEDFEHCPVYKSLMREKYED